MRAIPGFVGAEMLCRQEGTEAAFVTLTRFEDMADVLAFAGEDYETPVLEPEALRLLSRYVVTPRQPFALQVKLRI
jgi:hypothetical protein